MDYYRIVDSAEPEGIRFKLLERGWAQQRLLSGDFAFLTKDSLKFGITRKTVPDLLGSIGELFSKQLDVMLDTYDINMFLLEGTFNFDLATGYILNVQGDHNVYEVLDWLHRWQVKGFVFERSPSPEFTVYRLCHLYALWQKPYSLSARSRRWADERMLALPSGVRGHTGQRILEHFGSLRAIAVAGKQQLMSIEGVGSKKADLVLEHFSADHRRAEIVRANLLFGEK
jgi:ERCC4-type nuclease